MESLIDLVAASFARHGIECPDGWQPANSPLQVSKKQPSTKPASPTALPEHNYRKILDGDPAP